MLYKYDLTRTAGRPCGLRLGQTFSRAVVQQKGDLHRRTLGEKPGEIITMERRYETVHSGEEQHCVA